FTRRRCPARSSPTTSSTPLSDRRASSVPRTSTQRSSRTTVRSPSSRSRLWEGRGGGGKKLFSLAPAVLDERERVRQASAKKNPDRKCDAASECLILVDAKGPWDVVLEEAKK